MTKIRIKSIASKDIFVLFSALNALGYDDENNKQGMHPVRLKIRKKLLKYDWNKKYPYLKNVFQKYHQGALLIDILSKPIKTYKVISKITSKTPRRTIYQSSIKRFSQEPLIEKLWEEFKNAQLKENKRILPLFKKHVNGLIKFVNGYPLNVTKIILIVNPMDAYWRGYGPKIGKLGYVVVGPGADRNDVQVLHHELLHILAPRFRILKQIIENIMYKSAIRKSLNRIGYSTKKIISREYIVRALNLLYTKEILKRNISYLKEKKDFPKIDEVIKIVKMKLKKGAA